MSLSTSAILNQISFAGDDGEDSLINSGSVTSIIFQGGADRDILRNDSSGLTQIQFFGYYSPSYVPGVGGPSLNPLSDKRDLFVNNGSNIGSLSFIGGNDDDVLISRGMELAQSASWVMQAPTF